LRHAEQNALGAHVSVESLHVGDSEHQFDLSCWILVGSRVQRESGFACPELAPAGRLELQSKTKHIAVELHSFVHIGDELDRVSKLYSLHFAPPLTAECQLSQQMLAAANRLKVWDVSTASATA
jgi:hypothetical protein